MASLTRWFGDTPRVRLLEAILRLSPAPFTAADAARSAQLFKPSAYRAMRQLQEDGFVRAVTTRRPLEFVVDAQSPKMMALNYIESGISLILSAEDSGQAVWDSDVAALRSTLTGAVQLPNQPVFRISAPDAGVIGWSSAVVKLGFATTVARGPPAVANPVSVGWIEIGKARTDWQATITLHAGTGVASPGPKNRTGFQEPDLAGELTTNATTLNDIGTRP